MADTASYAGAMKTQIVTRPANTKRKIKTPSIGSSSSYTAKGRGDRRPPTGTGDLSPAVRRKAAANRMKGTARRKRPAVSPGPLAVQNIRPV